jgi:FeS assembly SUF system regulator
MLRISKLADYATLIMSQLAQDASQLSSASLLAKSLGLSMPVVSKILKILGQAGLVTSVRGADGGYRLARPAQDISLAQVVSAIEGDLALTECCSQSGACVLNSSCSTRNNWNVINKVIHSTLAKLTLKDMLSPMV